MSAVMLLAYLDIRSGGPLHWHLCGRYYEIKSVMMCGTRVIGVDDGTGRVTERCDEVSCREVKRKGRDGRWG